MNGITESERCMKCGAGPFEDDIEAEALKEGLA